MRDKKKIIETLNRLGVGQDTRGGVYLADCISLWEPECRMTKLMRDVAEAHDTTDVRVERCVRNQIERSATVGNIELLEKIVGWWNDSESSAPTKGRFISAVANYIDMEEQT